MALLLKKSTLYYRETTSDPWTPFIMSADANFVDFADEYSDSQTYTVGEYCRYDGDFWRCTTAISTAEAWNSAHWQKTTIGEEFQNYLPLTAGSGKPLTGNLTIQDNPIYIKNTSADVSAQSDTQNRSWNIICSDKNDVASAVFDSYFRGSDGYVYAEMQGRRQVNGSNVTNYLRLGVQADGTRQVSVSNGAAWREALGLGSSGNLPITIAQGGTGSTQITDTATASSIITPASGVTVSNAYFQQWGKVGTLYLELKSSSAITASGVNIGTLATGKRPSYVTSLPIATPAVAGSVTIGGSGIITVRAAISANASFVICGTFLIA